MSSRHSRIGLSLFALYMLMYLGFVLLSAFSPVTCMHFFGQLLAGVVVWRVVRD